LTDFRVARVCQR